MLVATTFWESFFLFLIFLPMVMLWAFALVDVFRRQELSGWSKAAWVACIIFVPFLGTFAYLIVHPARTRYDEAYVGEPDRVYTARPVTTSNGVSELQTLADLHDRGKLSDAEFATEKERVLGAMSAASA